MIPEMIEKARIAMIAIADYNQEQVDRMIKAMADSILENAEELAVEAVKETRLGRVDHKTGKNINMATNISKFLIGKKSVGVIEEIPEKGLIKIAHPVGVIGSIAPSTNPIITPLGNGLMALKGKNAMIVSPHPRSAKTTAHTVEILREGLASVGAPKDLLQVIEEPSVEKSQELMSQVDLIVATGGPGLVKAAYSSGKPAYGVGPGNVQLILDRDFDLEKAAELTVIGRSFDNGIVCACTQMLIYPRETEKEFVTALEAKGTYYVSDPEIVQKFRELLFVDGRANPDYIGQDPDVIASALGIEVPVDTQIIALKLTKSGKDELLAKEKMSPVLGMIAWDEFSEAIQIAKNNLEVEGKGHSTGILTHNQEHAVSLGIELPVSRIVVNQATIDAGGSPANGLNPTVSLGCGSWGNNIISENLKYEHLINISQVANEIIG